MTDSEGYTAQPGLCTFSQPGLPQLHREVFEADANVHPWTQQLPSQGPEVSRPQSFLEVFFTVASVKHEP